MTTIPDIIKAIKALWDADGTLGAIPLQHGRVETAPDAPYATIVCRSDKKEYNSGTHSIEDYLIAIRVYGGPLLSDADTYESAMGVVYDELDGANISLAGFMSLFRDEDDVGEDVARLDAQDVIVAMGTWTMTVEQTRGS